MICKQNKLVFFMIAICFSFHFARAVELVQIGGIVIPDRTSESIKIDGELIEEVWKNLAISKEFKTYHPVYGEGLGQVTTIWMSYNSQTLYFAFKCYDTDPQKIKTSISQRDRISRDDWIGVLIDPMGNKQTSYQFYVNPSGIQADYLYSSVGGMDDAPDFVWESAGKITDEGYQIEIGIPVESIRFKSGKEVEMGVLFVRNVSRLGSTGAWPELKPGQADFNSMMKVIYMDLQDPLKLEVLPNFTYSRNVERESDNNEWGESDISRNMGAALKYRITSSITTEATINPDFSQVESDTFQVQFNRRYPVFYTEKRPFFMEGMDVFDFGLINSGMMVSAVHTRCIADPGWGAKLSGASGKMNFAILAANDKAPGQSWEGDVNPNEGKDALWGIARAKYNIGSDNSLGILYSGRFFAGQKNNVVGADLRYRLLKNARITLSYLYSGTTEPGEDQVKNGSGINAMLQYSTRHLNAWAAYERYDKDFIMHSAFLNRTNISQRVLYLGPNFYMKSNKKSWFRRIQPYFLYFRLHDMGTGMNDISRRLGLDLYFTRQGFLKIEYSDEQEAWQGRLFSPKLFYLYGYTQIFKWLRISGEYMYGGRIYYDPEEPFLGTGIQVSCGLIFQPDIRLSMALNFVHNELRTRPDHQRFYSIDVFNLLTTYQFNKHFFVRGVVRYNNFQKKLLTDLLASFIVIPGTVMHLGYGSIYESREWQNNQWVPGQGHLLNVKNSLFFKVSYLWRIKQ